MFHSESILFVGWSYIFDNLLFSLHELLNEFGNLANSFLSVKKLEFSMKTKRIYQGNYNYAKKSPTGQSTLNLIYLLIINSFVLISQFIWTGSLLFQLLSRSI